MNVHPLDNPMWEALSTRQMDFNEGDDTLKYFPANMSPFVGLEQWNSDGFELLLRKLPAGRTFSFIYSEKVEFPSGFEVLLSIPLFQLVCTEVKDYKSDLDQSVISRWLTKEDVPRMIELTDMTKPGPFVERTIEFGDYMGIFSGEKLLAMAGNRIKVNGYSEVSAICTHPEHLGKGYASYLISKACKRIANEGFIPFLHVKADNHRAIDVYKKMGFELRKEVQYTIFRKL